MTINQPNCILLCLLAKCEINILYLKLKQNIVLSTQTMFCVIISDKFSDVNQFWDVVYLSDKYLFWLLNLLLM